MLEQSARSRSLDGDAVLLGLVDVLVDIAARADSESRHFMTVLGRITSLAALNDADRETAEGLDELVTRLAGEAEIGDVASFAASWKILGAGMVSRALGGETPELSDVRGMAEDLIRRHRIVRYAAVPGLAENFNAFDLNDEVQN